MKEVYYYEYSDDQIDWTIGECSFSLIKCVDMAQRCRFPWRIKTYNGHWIKNHVIEEALKQLRILEKITEKIS